MTRKYLAGIDFDTIGNTAWSRTLTGSHVRSKIFPRQKLLDRTRKKLIEELIRVGRLIDPAPGTGQGKGEGAAELPGIPQQSDKDTRSSVEDLEGLSERLLVARDEIASAHSDRLNRNLYILSVISAVFLPLSFLTGLLGINVGGIPGTADGDAFWKVTAALGGFLVLQVLVLWRMRWVNVPARWRRQRK